MHRAALILIAAVPLLARAESLEDWIHARVQEQRGLARPTPVTPIGPSGQVWRERAPSAPRVLPNFVPPTSLAPLVKAVRNGVVNISTHNEGTSQSLGSGFLINPDGLVVTNNHVVERAQSIQVRLADGREFAATVVGRDPSTDLALLRLPDAKELPTVTLGDSDQLEIGDWVVAIGNPFGLDQSVTHGLISARERVIGMGPFDDFIQTNANINPGNSGGPLFDMRGDVVGVCAAIQRQGQGIGFAVPINLVKELLPNLLANGRPERGWLGLNVQEAGEGASRGPVVVDVFRESPAEKAGIKPGDRVVAIGGKPVQRYQQILRRVALLQPGTQVKVEVVRAGRTFDFTATLAQRPSSDALRVMNSSGRVEQLGLAVRAIDANAAAAIGVEPGLRIEAVLPGGPADDAGLVAGDVIVEVNREAVGTLKDLEDALSGSEATDTVLVRVRRGTVLRYVAVKP
ncbi:MAG: trypsin-like peptidase domain-containing protein [Myxococcota bacterium]